MNRVFGILFLALFSSVSASAETPAGTLTRSVSSAGPAAPAVGKEASKDWRQETEATCGMTCRYHRANDNLTLQALYLVTKLGKIGDAIKNNREAEARTALGAFCKNEDEEVDACFKRYQAFQRVGLLEIRQSIGKNEDFIAKLTTGRKADGTVEGTGLAFETSAEKTPYLPDVPTLAELEASYLEGKLKPAGSKYSRAEIQKWSQSLVVTNPKARYLDFNPAPVVGNPYQAEKTSYSLHTLKSDGSRPSEDARAAQAYRNSDATIREFAEDKAKEISGNTKVIGLSRKFRSEDKISYEAFTQARSVVNSKIEGDVKRADDEKISRKIAAAPDPKGSPGPVVSPSPSPSPSVAASVADGVAREVKVTTGSTATRNPTGVRTYGDDEKVERPKEMKNSRYIKYDLGDLMNDIDASTK